MNHVTVEIRDHARAFLANPLGQAKLREQYENGELHPSLLQMLHHYAYGKPKEQVEHSGDVSTTVLVKWGTASGTLDDDDSD